MEVQVKLKLLDEIIKYIYKIRNYIFLIYSLVLITYLFNVLVMLTISKKIC